MRLAILAIPAIVVAPLTIGLPAENPPPATSEELARFVDAFGRLQPDPDLVGTVSGLTLNRDAAVFELGPGQVAALTMDGRIIGAVYQGEGAIRFQPPTDVEKRQLERYLGEQALDREISRAVFFFTDGTWEEIAAALQPGSTQVSGGMKGIVEDAVKFQMDRDRRIINRSLLSAFVNPDRPSIFHAHLDLAKGPDAYYRLDQARAENVTFGKDGPGYSYDQINSFRRVGVAAASGGGGGGAPVSYRTAEVVGYDMDVNIEENLDFSAEANLFAFTGAPSGTWVPFSLSSRLRVESVEWGGVPAEYMRREETAQLWVRIPESVSAGSPSNVVFRYEGDLIDRRRDWYILRSPTGWYPTSGATDATFDVRFTTHKKHKIMSAGKLTSSEEDGDRITTRWIVNEPAPHSSFNVGDFDETRITDPRIPPLTLHYSESAHGDLAGFLVQKDMGTSVGRDLVNSLAFFQETFGPTSATEFNATEIPYLHGQAFSGMVQLSFVTFQWTGSSGAAEIFRAHEIAHQWWGIGVKPKTYHDRWLSEGLAEFSGLWYMQRVFMSSQKYLDHLAKSRINIMKRQGKAGPISLGPRLVTSETEDDYQIIVYEKGAWVMHMLKSLMKDYDTMDDGRFIAMLRDFYQTNQGRSVSTEDFMEIAEKHIGGDLGWFFDQWVFGTEVPTYKWAVKGEALPSGDYKVTLRVDQSGVPDDFKMLVPVRLDFGTDGFAHVQVLVEGPNTVIELPLLPREPDEIVFNDTDAVLAKVDRVGW